eukprot:scaffold2047_cov129-Cylindrotheca_fusiformis.AAC.50
MIDRPGTEHVQRAHQQLTEYNIEMNVSKKWYSPKTIHDSIKEQSYDEATQPRHETHSKETMDH